MAQTVKHLPVMQETQFQSLGQEGPLEKEWQPTSVFLSGKSHGQRSLAGYSPWDPKSWTRLSYFHIHFEVSELTPDKVLTAF